MTSPTQRSLEHARARGWSAGVVERWLEAPGIRKDLWGCIDLIVLDDQPRPILVQACAGSSHAARAAKARLTISGAEAKTTTEKDNARALQKWLMRGDRIEVWSWSKRGARGKRKLWELRRENINLFEA
jgi:hypothetical protein